MTVLLIIIIGKSIYQDGRYETTRQSNTQFCLQITLFKL